MNNLRNKQKEISLGFFIILGVFLIVILAMLCLQIGDIANLGEQIAKIKASVNGYQDPTVNAILDQLMPSYLAHSISMAFKFTGCLAAIGLVILAIVAIVKNKEYKHLELLISIIMLIAAGVIFIHYFALLIASFDLGGPSGYGIANIVFAIMAILTAIAHLLFVIKTSNELYRKLFGFITCGLIIINNIIMFALYGQYGVEGSEHSLVIHVFLMITCLMTIFELVVLGEKIQVKTKDKVLVKSVISEKDPYEELTKLKDLLDKEIITIEEYNDKRQKYIDLL